MNEALWRVQLSTGEIRMMTLEALDEAFDEGLIDARVPVLAPGASEWTTLGEAAGLDEAPTEQAPSLSPLAIAPPSSTSCIPSDDAEQNTPFDLDLPDFERASRRRRGFVVAVAGAVGVAALLAMVVAGNVGRSATTTTNLGAAFAVEAPPPAAVEAPPPAVDQPAKTDSGELAAKVEKAETTEKSEKPEKAEDAEDAEHAEKADAKPELSDWQKRMLVDADKAREDKARAKRQEKAEKSERQPSKPRAKTSSGFLNGGDRFDPLNGAL